jgi:hypothetical protein
VRRRGPAAETYTGLIGQAARRGLKADTAAISDAVDSQNGGTDGAPVIRDLSDFEDACEDAGYDFG